MSLKDPSVPQKKHRPATTGIAAIPARTGSAGTLEDTPQGEGALVDKMAEMVRRIVVRFDPDQIILFGSHARGTARLDSDIDLMVVMPLVGSKREKQIDIRCALHDIQVEKDIIVVTPEELERRQNIVGTPIRSAMSEGHVVYARGR